MLVVVNLTEKELRLDDKEIKLQGLDYCYLMKDPYLHFERIEFLNIKDYEHYSDIRPEIIKIFNNKSETFGTHGVLILVDKLDKTLFLLIQELLLIKKFNNKKRKKFFLHKMGTHIPVYVGIWDENGNIEKIRIT